MTAEITAYAWVLDGISTIFVSDEGLNTAWAVAASFVRTHPGLRLPSSLSCGIDLRSGLLTDDSSTIEVDDVDGTLAAIFRASRASASALVNTLEPGTTAGASLYSKHVGTECIGAAGQRRRFSCVPGFAVGLKHYGQNEAFVNDLGATLVSDDPLLWTGRRCALYRVKKIGGIWQALSAAKRVWWGTLRGNGDYRRGGWSFSVFGLQSWAGGNLGRGLFTEGLPAIPDTVITDTGWPGDHRIWGALEIVPLDDPEAVHWTYGTFGTMYDATYLVGASNYADIVAGVNSFLDDVIADNGLGLEFTANIGEGNDIYFATDPGNDGITIRWKRGSTTSLGDPHVEAIDTNTLTCRLRLRASEAVWRGLGYDPRTQTSDRDPVGNEDQYGQFEAASDNYPGHWIGTFYSATPKGMLAFETGENFGSLPVSEYGSTNPRRWPPAYPGGAVTFTGQPGQEFALAAPDGILLAASKSRPLPADPDDPTAPYNLTGVGDVTGQAILVLEGPYRRRYDEDQVDPIAGYSFEVERERREGKTIQVVRVAFRANSDGSVAGTDRPRFVVMQWLEPRLFGFDFARLDGTWGARREAPPEESIRARPLAVWDARDAGDRISEVLQRILLTTGTGGGWYSDVGLTTPLYGLDGSPAYFDAGANDPGTTTVPRDAEDASLGLGVPSSMVAAPSAWAAVESAALGPELRRCKVAAYGVQSTRELFARVLAPTGLALSLSGGKYGIVDAWALPTPEQAVATLTPEYWAGRAGKPEATVPAQTLRKWAPIDVAEVKARIDPETKRYAVEFARAATDAGAAYRSAGQQIKHTVLADFVIDERVKIPGNSWRGEFNTRWRTCFDFWGADSSEVTAKLHAADGIDIWPGDGVLLTDAQLLGADGTYGVSVASSRVIRRTFDASKEIITLHMLVSSEADYRLYAPAAMVTRYDQNDLGFGHRLLCADDYLGDRVSGFDVDGFAEPSWSSEGGDADIEVFQFDGATWTGGIYGVVDSVTSSAGACSVNLTGALTGATYYRDRHTLVVLREWQNQGAAWVLRWFAPITEADYTLAGGGAGKKFVGL